jgi:hypothetical protein
VKTKIENPVLNGRMDWPSKTFQNAELKNLSCRAPMATSVILVTLEGRDQEDCISKPAQANSSQDPILKKNPTQNRAGGVDHVVECLSSKC